MSNVLLTTQSVRNQSKPYKSNLEENLHQNMGSAISEKFYIRKTIKEYLKANQEQLS